MTGRFINFKEIRWFQRVDLCNMECLQGKLFFDDNLVKSYNSVKV